MNQKTSSAYKASLKSLETENYVDRLFFRPIGFLIAKPLSQSCITPNQVTIFSIFVGVAAGPLFYFDQLRLTVAGILCLLLANILDCVDGQLARLTGKKSKMGRILDGLAGDIWFLSIYVFLALRLKNDYGTWLCFVPVILSGLSHLVQANITDYYKTLHLYFVSKEAGTEFQSLDEIRTQYQKMESGIRKRFFYCYLRYTSLQEIITPRLQYMLRRLYMRYGDDIPEEFRLAFRRKSNRLMKWLVDLMTFNGRAIVLFISVATGYVLFYFFYEIIILNFVLVLSVCIHEKNCIKLIKNHEN